MRPVSAIEPGAPAGMVRAGCGCDSPLFGGGEWVYTFFHLIGEGWEGCMPKTERDREISRRRQKRMKMEFLRRRLAEAKDSKARAAIAQKILKINPQANVSPK
jgi:hypothetical protein